jgi:hypothetical protein
VIERRCLVSSILVLSCCTSLASAQGSFDLTVRRIDVVQSLLDASAPLVGGRATYVRATMKIDGSPTALPIADALLRVRIAGQEIAGSPFFSDNGPITLKLNPNPAVKDELLNFTVVVPTASNVTFEVIVNPPGGSFVAETNTTNNSLTSSPYSFACRDELEVAYAPIDYRPSGGSTPNLPDPALIEPGIGDAFIQGIYPARDLDYHRIDAPSKLWTSSLSGSGSSLLSSLDADWQLMSPKPDVLYGWVPGPLPGYNGQATISGHTSMGNTELSRYQRTLAHEVGHNFGLQHNSASVNILGFDIESHLALPLGLPLIKTADKKDIMYAGLLTTEAWVAAPNWSYFYGHPWLACGTVKAASASIDTLLLRGIVDRRAGSITLAHVLTFEGGEPTPPAGPGSADLVLRAFVGSTLVTELPVATASAADACRDESHDHDADVDDPLATFCAVIPANAAIDRIEVESLVTGALRVVRASPSAPTAAFLPFSVSPTGITTIAWAAHDADNDALRSYLRYSPRPGHVVPLLSDADTATCAVDFAELPAPSGEAWFELLVTDGLRTTSIRTDGVLLGGGGPLLLGAGNAPWAHVVTPNPNTVYKKGATVLLHGNGFDLEDRMLDGSEVAWSSNLQGALGNGRILTVKNLAVGAHTITFAATDSANLTTQDTAAITIVDRPLPDVGSPICQTNLGFGGPGASQLSLCGGSLASGTAATLLLTGATPNQAVYMIAGLTSNPTLVLGGTLVPIPASLVLPLVANGTGTVSIPNVPGGNGPFSLYIQAIHVAPALPLGYGFSNAVRADFLP